MYGKLVTTPTNEVHVEVQIIGNEILVTARQNEASERRILCTIRKKSDYSDEFQILLGQNVKLISEVVASDAVNV